MRKTTTGSVHTDGRFDSRFHGCRDVSSREVMSWEGRNIDLACAYRAEVERLTREGKPPIGRAAQRLFIDVRNQLHRNTDAVNGVSLCWARIASTETVFHTLKVMRLERIARGENHGR